MSEQEPCQRSITRVSMTEEPILLESNQNHATVQTDGISAALPAAMGEGGGYVPMVTGTMAFKQGNGAKAGSIGAQEECAPTLSAAESGTNQAPAIMCGNPWDSQSERVYHGDGAWHNLNGNRGGGQSRDAFLHRR